MALTREIITANPALSALGEEQLSALVTLSENEEAETLGKKFGEHYRQLDSVIEANTGVKRNGDEKTYLYLERATKEVNERIKDFDKLQGKLADITKEKERLEGELKKGADTATVKALEQARKDLASITSQYSQLQTEYAAAKDKFAADLFDEKITNEMTAATSGIKFKKELPESVTSVVLSNVVAKVKAMNPEYVDDGNGGKILAFKDSTGAIMRNKENALRPFSASELISRELKAMDVLEERVMTGTGTKPTGSGSPTVLDFGGCKTGREADELITRMLISEGLAVGTKAFETRKTEIWKENNLNKLPVA